MGFLTTQKYKVHYIVKKDFLKQISAHLNLINYK